jgi:Response regulator containing CheY-like receiver domain and AraC-type DNA-binding domain
MNIDARVLWYYDIPKKKDNYFYPLDIEKLLINYTKLGNEKEVNRIIKRIFKENFEKGSISATATVHLFNEIQGTTLKITDMLEVKHKEEVQIIRLKLNLIDKYKNSEEIFDFIIRVFQELCDISDEGKHNRTEIILRITDYLNTNYMDSQLSLTSLADRFNFAPAYLSQLFKEEVGDNFSTYLEKIRIKKACEMLHNGETVNKIADCVGYNDVHVFRNAFKRITGQTPRDYKVKTEPRELFDI